MPQPCSKCSTPSVILVRYSGQHLCGLHFERFVEKRVKRDLRQQGPYERGTHVVVALSGGKDSVVTLRLLHETFKKNSGVSLSAVSVDEGIAGYRPPSLEVSRRHCEELGIPHHLASYEEDAGLTMDVVVRNAPQAPACATCGPLRRRSLNRAARDVGATHLATGHNLDDVAQSVLMNVLKGDVDRLARLGPHTNPKPGLIPRIMPLRAIPEKEVALYAILKGYEFHDGECPYSSEAARGRYRDLLLQLEREEPGTRHSLLAGYDRLAPLLQSGMLPATPMRACVECGEPTSGAGVCSACRKVTEAQAARGG